MSVQRHVRLYCIVLYCIVLYCTSPTSPSSPTSPNDYSTLTEGERLLLKDLESQLSSLIPYADFLNKFEKDLGVKFNS